MDMHFVFVSVFFCQFKSTFPAFPSQCSLWVRHRARHTAEGKTADSLRPNETMARGEAGLSYTG